MMFDVRRVLFALLFMSLIVLVGAAQDENAVSVVGSGVAGQAFQAVVTDATFEYDLTGTQNGVTSFCSGSADITLTNRPLTQAEATACASSGVEFVELLLTVDAYALVASPDVDFAGCVSATSLDPLLAPSASGDESNWNQFDPSFPDRAISFVLPPADSRAAALLDRIVRGEGFRSDAEVADSSAAIIADVAAGSGKLGIVSLPAALDAEGVTIIGLNNSTLGTCVQPTAESVFNRQYQGADRLFAYVNVGALEKPGVTEALAALTSAEAASALTAAEFLPLTDDLLAQAATVVAEGATGRVFSREVETFQVVGDTTGTLRVGGSASGASYLQTALETATARYGTITLEENYLGESAGIREFCNGNREIVVLSGGLSEEEQANCTANEIESYPVTLGSQAAVLVSNAESSYLACLTTSQIAGTFGASAEIPATWDAVDSGFGDDTIYLFVAEKGDTSVDLLMHAATGTSTPVRDDVQVNADPLYRAAAVANTPGAVTLLTLHEYQDVVAEGQQGIQLVAVQAEGGECVMPSVETISDGSYAVSRSLMLLVNAQTLETGMVQAALYGLFSDENFRLIEEAGLIGIQFADLVEIRAELAEVFTEADALEAERFAAEVSATQTAVATLTPQVTPDAEETLEDDTEATATPEP